MPASWTMVMARALCPVGGARVIWFSADARASGTTPACAQVLAATRPFPGESEPGSRRQGRFRGEGRREALPSRRRAEYTIHA